MNKAEIQTAFDQLNAKYFYVLKKLNEAYDLLDQKPNIVEVPASGDLRTAAELLAKSEMNKEDLSEDEIFDLLKQQSTEDTTNKLGFWAMPLPVDSDPDPSNTRYIGKKR